MLGPVFPTPGKAEPGQELGLTRFEAMIAETRRAGNLVPVYALGGLRSADLEAAWRHGAHGISMMRGAWA